MTDRVIEVQNFRKTYGDFVAVDDITFDVRRGEIFGLLGQMAPARRARSRAWRGCASRMAAACESPASIQPASSANCET